MKNKEKTTKKYLYITHMKIQKVKLMVNSKVQTLATRLEKWNLVASIPQRYFIDLISNHVI